MPQDDTQGNLVHLKWYDTVVFALAHGRPYMIPPPTIVEAVGWITYEDDTFLELRSAHAQQLYEDRTIFSLYIPKGAICYRSVLTDPQQQVAAPPSEGGIDVSYDPQKGYASQQGADAVPLHDSGNPEPGYAEQSKAAYEEKLKAWKHPAAPVAAPSEGTVATESVDVAPTETPTETGGEEGYGTEPFKGYPPRTKDLTSE